jgi:hypothetical protein
MSTFDGAYILDEVAMYLQRFVSYPSKHACFTHALWIAHTHLIECFESTPRLGFLSPEPEAGKTRALEVSQLLVKDGLLSFNVTPAYIVRKVAACQPTILYDEIDNLFSNKTPEVADVKALINGGYRRGAYVGRCVIRGSEVQTEELPAFAAVALAGIGNLPDAVSTRTIHIEMRRRAPDEHLDSFRLREQQEPAGILREKLVAWCEHVAKHIDLDVDMPPAITDRKADCWEPLFAVAKQAGEDWPGRCAEAALFLIGRRDEHTETEGTKLLADIREAFEGSSSDKMPTETLLLKLQNLPESPWNDVKGKPLDQRGLASRLKPYGIKSKDVAIGGNRCLKGYTAEAFHDAWNRYLPASPSPERDEGDERDLIDNNNKNIADIADIADGRRVEGQALQNGNGSGSGYPEMPTFLDRRTAPNGKGELGFAERVQLYVDHGMSRQEAEAEAKAWQ